MFFAIYTPTYNFFYYETLKLNPNDVDIQKSVKEELENSRQYAKKLTVVSLSANATADTTKKDDQAGGETVNLPAVNALSSSVGFYESSTNRVGTTNQKVLLVKYLVKIGDLINANKMLEKLPTWYLATFPKEVKSICTSLHQIIEPLYYTMNTFSTELLTKLQNKTSSKVGFKITTIKEFIELVMPIICSIGPGVSSDTILFSQLVRICIGFLNKVCLINRIMT